mgnify:CR=1 FL=1
MPKDNSWDFPRFHLTKTLRFLKMLIQRKSITLTVKCSTKWRTNTTERVWFTNLSRSSSLSPRISDQPWRKESSSLISTTILKTMETHQIWTSRKPKILSWKKIWLISILGTKYILRRESCRGLMELLWTLMIIGIRLSSSQLILMVGTKIWPSIFLW